MTKLLTKEEILKSEDRQQTTVEVPEWGGSITMRSLSGEERDSFEASCVQGMGRNTRMNMINLRAKLVGLCVVDDKNERLFPKHEDVLKLGKKNGKVLDRLFRIAQALSGLSEDAVKELTEGLDSAQSEGSTSD